MSRSVSPSPSVSPAISARGRSRRTVAPAAPVTSAKRSPPRFRSTRISPFCSPVSPTAARSSQPSLSTSTAAIPHPRIHVWFGNRDAFESRAADVLPQAETRRTPVREGQVHPTVLIEIDCDSAGRRRWKDRVPRLRRPKRALAWIAKDERGAPPSSQDKVDGAIVVEIGCDGSNTWRVTRESRLLRCVRKGSIAVVAPHLIRRRVRRQKESRTGRSAQVQSP